MNIPDIDRQVELETWRQIGNPLPWVRVVRVFRAAALTKHHWAVPDSGWVQMDFIEELQQAIDAKNARHASYMQYCDECWLLVTASGGRPSGLFELSEETRGHVYRSCFTKTFFMEVFGGVLVQLTTTAT